MAENGGRRKGRASKTARRTLLGAACRQGRRFQGRLFLAPGQEFDGVITGRHVRLDAAELGSVPASKSLVMRRASIVRLEKVKLGFAVTLAR